MVPWPPHCKIREKVIYQKRNVITYTFNMKVWNWNIHLELHYNFVVLFILPINSKMLQIPYLITSVYNPFSGKDRINTLNHRHLLGELRHAATFDKSE